MKNESSEPKIMEKGILSEENVVEEPQVQTPKPAKKLTIPLKNRVTHIIEKIKYSKKPRLITIGIILASIVAVSIALILIAGRNPKEQPKTVVKITIPTPEPTPDLEVEQAKKEVLIFKGELDALDSELENVKFPQIDLNIEF